MKTFSLALLVMFSAGLLFAAPLSPIEIDSLSFNSDIIVEASAQGNPVNGFNDFADASMNANGDTFYEVGLNPGAAATGLPINGGLFASALDSTHIYRLLPYDDSNALVVGPGESDFLDFVTPAAYRELGILVASGDGTGSLSVTVNFADGTNQAFTITSPNWLSTDADAAFIASGRVNLGSRAFNTGATSARLYEQILNLETLGLDGKTVTDLDFLYTGTGNAAIFAISGLVAIPEPSTAMLCGLVGLAAVARRRPR